MINWSKYFDHIFCITYIDNGRYDKLCESLNKVGILKSGIFEFMYDCDFKYKKEMYNNIYAPWVGSFYLFPCTIQHVKLWNIIKCLGYKRVLILEDDNAFLKDINKIEQILDNAEFKDITLLHYYWLKDNIYYSSSCYTVNQHGVDVLLDNFEKNKFTVVDQLFMGSNNLSVTHIQSNIFTKNKLAIHAFHEIKNFHVNDYNLSTVYPIIATQHINGKVENKINKYLTDNNADQYDVWLYGDLEH